MMEQKLYMRKVQNILGDSDYLSSSTLYGPGKWYHSEGPYSEYSRQYECLLFYVDGIYRENITFEIEYERIMLHFVMEIVLNFIYLFILEIQ